MLSTCGMATPLPQSSNLHDDDGDTSTVVDPDEVMAGNTHPQQYPSPPSLPTAMSISMSFLGDITGTFVDLPTYRTDEFEMFDVEEQEELERQIAVAESVASVAAALHDHGLPDTAETAQDKGEEKKENEGEVEGEREEGDDDGDGDDDGSGSESNGEEGHQDSGVGPDSTPTPPMATDTKTPAQQQPEPPSQQSLPAVPPDSSFQPLPPFVLEFHEDFYSMFAPLPYADGADVLFSDRDQSSTSHWDVRTLCAELKSLFDLRNDLVLEFPDLELSFHESSTTTETKLSTLVGFHSALGDSGPVPMEMTVPPVKVLLLESRNSFQDRLEYLRAVADARAGGLGNGIKRRPRDGDGHEDGFPNGHSGSTQDSPQQKRNRT